jgi:H+/Cl- antiporter ClcA
MRKTTRLSLSLLFVPLLVLVFPNGRCCYGFQQLLPHRRSGYDPNRAADVRRWTTKNLFLSKPPAASKNKKEPNNDSTQQIVKSKATATTTTTTATKSSSSSSSSSPLENLPYYFQSEAYHLFPPALVGVLVGCAVAAFKLSVEGLRELSYGNYPLPSNPELLLLLPTFGGLAVGLLRMPGVLPPGLRETIEQVDNQDENQLPLGDFIQTQSDFFRKSVSSVVTLGTGNSLGPEGPSVELGVNVAKIVLQILPELPTSTGAFPMAQKRRLLLSCGAAAGVSAGFNAPIAGVFFALEIVQGAFQYLDNKNNRISEFSATSPGTVCALLLSSVLAAFVSRAFLGSTMVLTLSSYSLNTPALELPIFLFLGVLSGIVAFVFSRTANFSQYCFKQGVFKDVPLVLKPALGGLFCGTVGVFFPQVLFFGR